MKYHMPSTIAQNNQIKINNLLMTVDAGFISRYRFLLNALSSRVDQVDYLAIGNRYDLKLLKQFVKTLVKQLPISTAGKASAMRKNATTFIRQSRQTEKKIRSRDPLPDFVLHIFGMHSPFWERFDIPYAMYLDYTMALADRAWAPWAPFASDSDFLAWKDCERMAYERAFHLFPMSHLVKDSLVKDYGIAPEKITVVGASGQFQSAYEGEKSLGSHRLLFNGSDFDRKGGKLVLDAFKLIKASIPDAELVIVGTDLPHPVEGVNNPGAVAWAEMQKLFLSSDLLLAPAFCEPYANLLIEAMNYGVPCVASNVDGVPEVIDHNLNGIVLPELSADCLARSAIELLQNPLKLAEFSQNARHKVNTQMTWHHVVQTMLQVLNHP